jgi:hypothetical protein
MSATVVCNNHTIRVQIGEICSALICHDADIFERLKESYHIFLSDKTADITVKLDIIDRPDCSEVDESLCQRKSFPQEKLNIGKNRSFNIEFDAASNKFLVTVERGMFTSPMKLRPMNHLFRLSYYTGTRSKQLGRPPWMLVHSCGILRKGKALLFTGPSETGKTTVGRLCGEDYGLPLNDEMVLLSWPHPPDRGLLIKSAPILGELPFTINTVAPLCCVFLLKQSQRTAVRRVGRMEAYLRFLNQIISPAYFKETNTRAIVSLIEEFADEVTRATPFFELEFTLDKNLLWEVESRLTELEITEG